MRHAEEEINAKRHRHSVRPLTPRSAEQVCMDSTQQGEGGIEREATDQTMTSITSHLTQVWTVFVSTWARF